MREPILKPVHELLVTLNDITRELMSFESLEVTFARTLDIAARSMPLRSAVVIEARDGSPHSAIWLSVVKQDELAAAPERRAQMAFDRLTSLSEDVALAGDDLAKPTTEDDKTIIVLPLVVDHHNIFGVLTLEYLEEIDEPTLAFVNAVANQLAIAIDRQFVLKERERLSQRERAAKENAAELQRQKDEAKAANIAKSQFLANMSHEIRTPLGAVLGFAELLAGDHVSEAEKTQYGLKIRKNGATLTRLIDDILDLTKIESGKVELAVEEFSLLNLMADLASLFTSRAHEKGIGFKIGYQRNFPRVMRTDPIRLKQVLTNVIGNAIKFTEHGSIAVDVEGVVAEGKEQTLFLVSDTGVGITEDTLLKLFQPFGQGDCTSTKKFGGTGLGLILSRRLAIAMGGNVCLSRSTPGEGSTFAIVVDTFLAAEKNLPAAVAAVGLTPPALATNKGHLDGKQILLVDDSSDNRTLYHRILKNCGASVDTAANGCDAVKQALAKYYDVILMDLQMPVQDGFSATEELRGRGYRRPIIALSAYAMKEEREHAFRSGCNDHLAKPVSIQTFIDKLSACVGSSPQLH